MCIYIYVYVCTQIQINVYIYTDKRIYINSDVHVSIYRNSFALILRNVFFLMTMPITDIYPVGPSCLVLEPSTTLSRLSDCFIFIVSITINIEVSDYLYCLPPPPPLQSYPQCCLPIRLLISYLSLPIFSYPSPTMMTKTLTLKI